MAKKSSKSSEARRQRKATGTYYTPECIVHYIVKETIGKQIEGKTPTEIAELNFADISCGAGAFLLGAYETLLEYHTKFFNERVNRVLALAAGCERRPDGTFKLSFAQRRQILTNNIYGVDIDERAVVLSQLVLYTKLTEDELPDATPSVAWEIAQHGDEFLAGIAPPELGEKIKGAIKNLERFGGMNPADIARLNLMTS